VLFLWKAKNPLSTPTPAPFSKRTQKIPVVVAAV
jgi:hypothetical protein